jgi:hypothetical protein
VKSGYNEWVLKDTRHFGLPFEKALVYFVPGTKVALSDQPMVAAFNEKELKVLLDQRLMVRRETPEKQRSCTKILRRLIVQISRLETTSEQRHRRQPATLGATSEIEKKETKMRPN